MRSIIILATLTACGGASSQPEVARRPAPIATSALAACTDAGRPLSEVFSVSNHHGAVAALAMRDGTAALAGADGSIKTWDISSQALVGELGTTQSPYGGEITTPTPFTALALDDAGAVLAGNTVGQTSLFDVPGQQIL